MVADGRWPPAQVRGVNEPLLKVGRATITENVNGSAGSEASTVLVELEIDEWIHMGRGEGRRFCGWPATTVIVFAGVGFYGMPAALIMAPAYLDRELEREWFGGDGNEGSTQLFAVSSAFFMVWGLAAFAFTWAADQYGRKPLLVAVGLLGLLLNASNAAAPNFGTYAVLHPLTAVAIGPSGAISYVLSAEWTSPCDLSLLTLLLNSSFSLSSCLVAGLCALGLPWRKMQMLLGLFVALPLLGLPFVPESPRYLLAKGRCAQAESVLRAALRRAGVAPPPLHVTLKRVVFIGLHSGCHRSCGRSCGRQPVRRRVASGVFVPGSSPGTWPMRLAGSALASAHALPHADRELVLARCRAALLRSQLCHWRL